MTDYDYILAQCRKAENVDIFSLSREEFEKFWKEELTDDCLKHLRALSDKELCDLLFETEVQALGTIHKLPSAIIRAVPTIKLAEILHTSCEYYRMKNGKERSEDFYSNFMEGCKLADKELRRRYLEGIDSKVIENVFNHLDDSSKAWIRSQKKKQKSIALRYQDAYLKRFENIEQLYTDDDVDEGFDFDHVISIKGCKRFWDEEGVRLGAVDYILYKLCNVSPQYIGLGDEVVFAVTRDETTDDEEYQRNLLSGCLLIEKYVHQVDPKVRVKVQCHDRDYLVGRFVIEASYADRLFGNDSYLSDIEKIMPA